MHGIRGFTMKIETWFREVVEALPAAEREAIEGLWSRHLEKHPNASFLLVEPALEVSERLGVAYAHGVIHVAPIVASGPEESAKAVLAHELAHMYQFAIDFAPSQAQRDYALHLVYESEAIERANGWGFDQSKMSTFYLQVEGMSPMLSILNDDDTSLIQAIVNGFNSGSGVWDRVRLAAMDCIQKEREERK